jgi:hypothetical protein
LEFAAGLAAFLVQATADRGFGGFGGPSLFGRFGNGDKHTAEFLQAIGGVSAGIAKSLAGYQEITVGG